MRALPLVSVIAASLALQGCVALAIPVLAEWKSTAN